MKATAVLPILFGIAPAALADVTAVFDKPAAVQAVPNPSGDLRCTWYSDVMVRETGVDSPAPGPATLVQATSGRPGCDAQKGAHEIPLATSDYSFAGRKGGFLVFTATDPNAAVPFMVIDAGSGRTLYTDATAADRGIRAAEIADRALRLRFTRG
ncbi:MAG TPA: hypothetical protein VHS58_22970 [Acetobacteraceae bacterium]|nr:hypothetical protein [Acetobacteraceae bacterium]